MSYSEHSEAFQYWHRDDQSGQDACSIEADWMSERERARRDMRGIDLLDAMAEDKAVLASIVAMAIEGNEQGVGLMICALVRKYTEDEADRSIFGKITRRAS
jgi:hypothetical protein